MIFLQGEYYEIADFPKARAFICPQCLKTWCLLGGSPPYHIIGASCEKCNQKSFVHPVPGSVLNCSYSCEQAEVVHYTDLNLIPLLPPNLLKREFNLILRSL